MREHLALDQQQQHRALAVTAFTLKQKRSRRATWKHMVQSGNRKRRLRVLGRKLALPTSKDELHKLAEQAAQEHAITRVEGR